MTSYTKQTVPRNEEGWKMYPGRFWSWPDDLPDINTYDGQMQYGEALWTNTEENMPTERQLRYVLYLLNTQAGADPALVNWSSKRGLGQSIQALLRLPTRKGGWARPGREV